MNKLLCIAIALAACGNGEEAGRQAAQEKAATEHKDTPAPPAAVHVGSADPTPPPAAKPKEPEPDTTDPVQLDHALKQAMIDGRDKDVLRYCDLSKFDAKSNPQSLLGCTLSACRIKDADTAKRYAAPLAKAYLDQAKRVCLANQVAI